MKYILMMGELWELTNENYHAFLKQMVTMHFPNPEHYGRSLGTPENMTDWTLEQVKAALEMYEHAKQKARKR